MERIAMSQAERDELDWLKRAKDGIGIGDAGVNP